MIAALTAEQMRAYDRHASTSCGVPGIVLMENAGRGAAERIAPRMTEATGPAVILCGKGNNGGDGFVVARHLEARGFATEVFLLGRREDVKGDARTNLDALLGVGVDVTALGDDLAPLGEALDRAGVVVDALFGTGLSRPLEGAARDAVLLVNDALRPVVSLDVPSGLDATTGEVLGVAVRATTTLTFAQPKTGLLQGAGVQHAGEVEIVALGLPDAAIVETVGFAGERVDPADVLVTRGFRAPDLHKYRAGNVLVIAGSPGKTGAALLAATAALRSGAGLVTVATWPETAAALDGRVLEVMTASLERDDVATSLERALERRGAVAVGPGLGLDAAAREVVSRVALGWAGPVVLDADALTHFAGRAAELVDAPGPRVLTPHGGELARLLGVAPGELERDRFGAARTAAEVTGAVVVFKGPHPVIAHPAGAVRYVEGAEPLLATAGSGDVLAGLLAALLVPVRGVDEAFDAACAGVFLHLRAARIWRADAEVGEGRPDRGLLASELVAALPRAFAAV